MKIKRIEITGFKSFVERTFLDFDDGITSIVGPNGCGKSNVVDAIRWVMGEQNARNLRGKLMEDVIFGGSENRKPLGMAEVNLIMDNTSGLAPAVFSEYSEIQVTRRLYRNGDSEYLLNKTPCRLLDITELFMDTGIGTRAYSIIEQGKIGMIINSKPEDRRALIEEAAGVTKFKARKKTALRKIEATRQNLLRLSDIISEVRRQMNSLKRQAQRAKRFREFREELRELELQFGLREYSALLEKAQHADSSAEVQLKALDNLTNQLEKTELGLEQARLIHEERDKATALAQENVFKLTSDIQRIEGRLEFGAKEISSLERYQERVKAEVAAIIRRLKTADEEEVQLRQEREKQTKGSVEVQDELADREEVLHKLTDEEIGLGSKLDHARQKLYQLLAEKTRISGQQDDANRRLGTLADLTSRNRQEAIAVNSQLKQLQENSNTLNATLKSYEKERGNLLGVYERLNENQVSITQQKDDVEKSLLSMREALSRQRSRLESLQQIERNLEGYTRGVKALLSNARHKSSMKGMVADILEVPSEYEAAIEAVLGDRLQALLPDNLANVLEALTYLQENQGRCTFLLPKHATVDVPKIEDGVPVLTLLKIKGEIKNPIVQLLTGTYLVDNFDRYLDQKLPPGTSLVTPEGNVLTYRGELTGGGRQVLDQGLLHKKREMKELHSEVKALETEVGKLNHLRESLRDQATKTDTALRQTQNDLHQHDIHVLDHRKDLDGMSQEDSRLQDRIETLNLEEMQLHEEQELLHRTLSANAELQTGFEQEERELENELKRLQNEMQSLRDRVDEARQKVTESKVFLASLQEREEGSRLSLERLEKLREELEQRQETLEMEAAEASETQTSLRQEAEELKVEMEALYHQRVTQESNLQKLKEKFEDSRQDIESRETELKHLRHDAHKFREELSSKQMMNRELELEIQHMLQNFMERYRIDLTSSEVNEQIDKEFDETKADERRVYLQKRIDEIGEVNLMAIDEYQELEERYVYMTEQQEDLQKSLLGLQSAIAKINRTTRKRFRETFDQVNGTFQNVFPRLFNGGQAELRLTDESDLLETGIDVVAQPPGKKLQNVTLLSGGEKALTAVAIIFSIFLIKPSPFCLLDEVDAPLDDANIGRFNEIVKEMAEASQFIIITHNKRTMEIADNLYGITMEEPGVSKLVSVRLKEVA